MTSQHDRYRNSKNRLVDQFDRPTIEEGKLTSVGETVPFGMYLQPDGSQRVGLAFPGMFRGELPDAGSRSDAAADNYGRMFLAGQSLPRMQKIRREEMPSLDAVLDWVKSRAVSLVKKPRERENSNESTEPAINSLLENREDQTDMAQPLNNLLRYAQSTGGAPYDEEAYMPAPGQPGSPGGANRFLANRLVNRLTPQMMEYIHGGYPGYAGRNQPDLGMGGSPGNGHGSDMDMMRMYGPEDQVAFDQQGNPIPLADPRHPRNQQREQFAPSYGPPMYPQQRR